MTQIFDVPEQIPPATLYGDKSHAMQKCDTLKWVRDHPQGAHSLPQGPSDSLRKARDEHSGVPPAGQRFIL